MALGSLRGHSGITSVTRRAFLVFTAVLVRVIRGQGRASFADSGKWPITFFFLQIFKFDDIPTIRMSSKDISQDL